MTLDYPLHCCLLHLTFDVTLIDFFACVISAFEEVHNGLTLSLWWEFPKIYLHSCLFFAEIRSQFLAGRSVMTCMVMIHPVLSDHAYMRT